MSLHAIPGYVAVVKIKLLPGAQKPLYASAEAAGADLHAFILEDGEYNLVRGARALIRTGVHIELPTGYEAQIRSRSGIATNFGIHVFNAPGTIDSDYRGEISVLLRNSSNKDFLIRDGMRIAQMVIAPVIRAQFDQVNNFTETHRGSGGFGSSGV